MADRRGIALVVLLLLSATAVGALAGYRMHLHEEWHQTAAPVNATVLIDFPDGTAFNATVLVQGGTANALGALETAGARGGFEVGVRETSFGVFVHTIAGFRAEPGGQCGWLYSVGEKGEAHQPHQAADRQHLDEGARVFWYWGCI